jgi:hypothetical protein
VAEEAETAAAVAAVEEVEAAAEDSEAAAAAALVERSQGIQPEAAAAEAEAAAREAGAAAARDEVKDEVEDEVEDETEYVEVNLMVASSSPMRQRTAHLLHLQSWWIHSSMPCRPFKQWGRLRQGLKFIRALLWMWQTQTPFCPVGVSFACGFTCGFTGTEKNASDALERRTESTVAGLERLAITW